MSATTSVNHIDRRVARTANLSECGIALQIAIEASDIVGFFGPIGSGKSICASYIANLNDAQYLPLGSEWKKRYFMERLLDLVGLTYTSREPVAAMVTKVSRQLAQSRRPIVIDEFDYAVKNQLVDIVRDIWEESRVPIMIIGEHLLSQKIEKDWGQFHSRAAWRTVVPAGLADARLLRELYSPDVVIHDDLLQRVVAEAGGSARCICNNIKKIRQVAKNRCIAEVDVKTWGGEALIKNTTQKRWTGTRWEDV